MPSMEHFDEYMAKADKAADKAIEALPTTKGTDKAALNAALATMWVEMARMELDRLDADTLGRKIEWIGRRLATIEARLKIEAEEPPALDVIFGADDDDDDLAATGV